jgi:hypothetical protein
VLIVAALPDPAGTDRGHELVTLLNTTNAPIDLTGWGVVDAAGGRKDLGGTVAAGGVVQVAADGKLQLGNRGDALVLVDGNGSPVDQVSYKADLVRLGRTICFGRQGTQDRPPYTGQAVLASTWPRLPQPGGSVLPKGRQSLALR